MKKWRSITTFFHKIIRPTLYFSKGVVAGVCVSETGKGRETKTNCYRDPILLLLCVIFRVYIFPFSDSSSAATAGRCHTGRLVASLCDWLYLDSRLLIEDWTDPWKTSHICCKERIYTFRTPTYSDCHLRVLQSHCLHGWNILLHQNSICSTK